MNKIIPKINANKMLPSLVAIGPYEIYLNQVKASIESIRYQNKDMQYIPPQLGGLTGQRTLVNKSLVLETIDFEVN